MLTTLRNTQQLGWLKLVALGFAISMAAVLIGCGGGSEAEPTPAAGTSTPAGVTSTAEPVGSGPGEISVSSTAIEGQSGKILLILVLSAEQGGGPLARACLVINSNLHTVAETAMTGAPEADNPCGDPTAAVTLPEGTYLLDAGIFVPGSQTAEKQVTQTVEVRGDVTLVLDGEALSR